MLLRWKRMRKDLEERVGSKLFYSAEVLQLVKEFSTQPMDWDVQHRDWNAIREELARIEKNLDPLGIKAQDHSINPKEYWIFVKSPVVLYTPEVMWGLLKQYEKEGKIELKSRGITNLSEALEVVHEKTRLQQEAADNRRTFTPRAYDWRTWRTLPLNQEPTGSWENVVRAYEDNR